MPNDSKNMGAASWPCG